MVSTIVDALINVHSPWVYGALAVAAFLLTHLGPYLIDTHCIRTNGVTGPLLAKFSDAWFGWVVAHAHASEVVRNQHRKYGTFVRLAPNHVSISDPDAIQIVYGHGSRTLKSDFYDAFVSIQRNIATTRSRAEHARKRKTVSHVFAQKSIVDFEPYIHLHVAELLEQWDNFCDRCAKGLSGNEAEGWKGHIGRVWFNCMPWLNYWAFDTIGDLAFGSPFGMIRNARDAAPVAADQKAAMASYHLANKDHRDPSQPSFAVKEVPAVKILNSRSEYSASMGALPPWWRPVARILPWYAQGSQAAEDIAGMAIAAVAKRLAFPTDRTDILSKLQQGKDEEGKPLGIEEISAEALVTLVAGSDTVANSSCAITFYVATNPHVQAKLQKELDEALGQTDDPVTTYAQVKRLPYLEAVINEGLRIHSTAGLGLPRVVPECGLTVNGKTFPQGTVISVPTYTIHRDPDVWGADADIFRPERWFEHDQARLQKAFNPFSYGPRACIGRNLAMTELLIVISSIFRRYDLVLEQPDKPLETMEGFIRKPMACHVGMKRRKF